MAYKYQTEIDQFADFSFDEFIERQRTCYRWVFEPIVDDRNFKPMYLLFPEQMKRNCNCKGWALSFFDTVMDAKKRILLLSKSTPQICKKVGTHVAIGKLDFNDGVSDLANSYAHFDHFEYEGVDLSANFTILEQITR